MIELITLMINLINSNFNGRSAYKSSDNVIIKIKIQLNYKMKLFTIK